MIKRTVLFLSIGIFFFGCGKKGPLKLVPPLLPLAIENFQISQVGDTVKLRWNFPQTLADKSKTLLEPDKITRIYIYYSGKEIPWEKFEKKATLLRKLKMEDLIEDPGLPGPTTGTPAPGITGTGNPGYFFTIPFKLKELDNKDHFWGVQYYYEKKKSPLGEVAFIRTIVPVKAPTDFKINREKKVIKLTWSKPVLDEAGKNISITGYNVYRKIEPEIETGEPGKTKETGETGTPAFVRINPDNVLVEYFEDKDTGTNGNYSYYVSASISKQIESASSQEASVEITDIFPPEIPANLVCFKAQDHLFLTWRPAADPDLSHYRVYRRSQPGTRFQLAADNIAATSYKDKDVETGKTYFYSVTAVDKKNNESEFSNEVKEQF